MFRKWICLMLVLVLTVGLSACREGSKKTPEDKTVKDSGVAADGSVYLYDEKEIGSNSGIKSPGNSRVNGNNQLVVLDNGDGNGCRFVTLDGEGKPAGEILCPVKGYVMGFDLDSRGNFWILASESKSESETAQSLITLDPSGKILRTIPLLTYNFKESDGSIPMAMDVAADLSDNIYIATLKGIRVFDKSGQEMKKLGSDAYYTIDTDGDNFPVALNFGKGQRTLERIDPASGKSVWRVDLSKAGSGGRALRFNGNSLRLRLNPSNGTLCLMDENGVAAYDREGKPTGLLLDFKLYSILASGNSISDMSIDNNGNIYVTTVKDKSFEIYLYNIAGGSHKAKKRELLTVGVPSAEKWLEMAASKFQKAYPEYRVELKEYASGTEGQQDGEDYVKILNTEILSGKGPDIISATDLPYDRYIEKNILSDLSGLMEKDKSFDRSRYYTNILDALKYKGKLYTLPVSFTFDLFSANETVLQEAGIRIDDGQWTWKELEDLTQTINKAGDAKARMLLPVMSRTDLLDRVLQGNYNSFVDFDGKKASFDSRDFVDLLEMVALLEEEERDPNTVTKSSGGFGDINAITNGSVLFAPQTFSDYINFPFLNALYKDQLRLMKIPSIGKKTGDVFNSKALFAINNNSGNKEAAWEFLKFLISEEVQSDELGGFSVNREALAKAAKRAMDMTGSGNMTFAVSSRGGKPQIIKPKPLSQKDIDYVNSFIEGLQVYNHSNPEVKQTVMSEASTFFSGQKSAEEAAGVIQNKVGIYLGE